ncbi:MAG: AMP-binding protein [Pseudomonadales bacterium]
MITRFGKTCCLLTAAHQLPRFPFNHPRILFSSGTTGLPKCIVYSGGGTLLRTKEHQLHCDIRTQPPYSLHYTTTSWMMWHSWMVSSATATLMLYDGSPVYPSETVLFDYIDTGDVTLFGTSAKFIDNWQNRCRPEETHNLEHSQHHRLNRLNTQP